MLPFAQFPDAEKKHIAFVLTDIDDTLTFRGRLPSSALIALERLKQKKIRVIPITGRPAGWCDHMARMWPIDGIVGENGAFYFRYDPKTRRMHRRFARSEAERRADRSKLKLIEETILREVHGSRVSADQAYRVADLAIDFCEDVPRLSDDKIDQIVRIFNTAGARAKISSIHVNGWFGHYDKRTMTGIFFEEVFHVNLEKQKRRVLFSGDSPNDAPLFAFFPHSVGMANIVHFKDRLDTPPAWITAKEGGHGFAEMVEILLQDPPH